MIVQFFNRGKGGGSGPIDYLLGKDRDREEAKLLRGDPEETAALIDSSDYAKKYTAGCLSFEESNIPAEQKRALMDSFEECIFAGLDKDQYNCLWVEHRDKGRLELNFVIPNIELLSGKRLQPYYYAADRGRVDAWRTMQNLTHGYSDPDDPAKRQSMTQAKDLPRNTQEAAQSITDGLEALALAGKVKSRADVLETLEKAGFEISRATPSSISIKNPDPKGRNIRLKGALYEQDFRFGEDLRADITHRSRQHRAANESRLRHATAKYQRGIEAKRAENNRRYTRPAVTHEQGSIQALSVELARHIGNRFDSRRDIAHSDIELKQRIGRSETAESRSRAHTRPVEHQDQRFNTGKLPGREQQSNADMRSDRPEFAAVLREQRQNQSLAVHSTEKQQIGVTDDRDRNRIVRRIGELGAQSQSDREANAGRVSGIREQSRSNRAANDESLNALGRKVGRARAGKHEFSEAFSELGSRVRTAERNTDRTGSLTAAAERNLEAVSRTVRQKHERTQSRGWGMSL